MKLVNVQVEVLGARGIPLLAEQRVLGFRYIVGTTDDRTFCHLWSRYESFNMFLATLQ